MELNKLVGIWKGTCKTWFEPEVLADESDIDGSIQPVLNGKCYAFEKDFRDYICASSKAQLI